MAITLSGIKRIDWKQTIILNYLLYLYPSIIFFSAIYVKEVKLSTSIPLFTFQIFSWILIIPLIFAIIIGPAYSLLVEAARALQIPVIQNLFFIILFPFGTLCCLMIFVGTPINFLLAWLVSDRFKLEDNPHLFRWNSYITLIKPREN